MRSAATPHEARTLAPWPLLVLCEREPIAEAPPVSVPAARRRPWRIMRETSRWAWYQVGKTLAANERAVFIGLAAHWNRRQYWPTAMELFEFLVRLRDRHPDHPRYRWILDINNVRPRLTMMNQHVTPAGVVVPIVVTHGVRLCTSRHAQRRRAAGGHPRPVLTWAIPQLGDRS